MKVTFDFCTTCYPCLGIVQVYIIALNRMSWN